MNKNKIIKVIAIVFVAVLAFIYIRFFTSNTNFEQEEVYVEVPTGSTYQDVEKLLSPLVKSMSAFEFIAARRSYPENVKPGRFLLKKGMSAFQMVRAMRSNVPVKLAFNNQERLEDLCQRLSSQIEPDTAKLLASFYNPKFLKDNAFTKETVFAMFLPNTYEVYWNISAEKFRGRMLDEYNRFWTKERLAKAAALNLTPVQVITVASIVHKESIKKSERPTIAGVYLNRYKQGIPLQADPTVIYAKKLQDHDFNQVIKRVVHDYLVIKSPYNTYQNIGLPPGPIAMPDVDAIDAVLNPEKHNYIYFCASVEKFGYHAFAATYEEHQKNARKYADWLNKQGITK